MELERPNTWWAIVERQESDEDYEFEALYIGMTETK